LQPLSAQSLPWRPESLAINPHRDDCIEPEAAVRRARRRSIVCWTQLPVAWGWSTQRRRRTPLKLNAADWQGHSEKPSSASGQPQTTTTNHFVSRADAATPGLDLKQWLRHTPPPHGGPTLQPGRRAGRLERFGGCQYGLTRTGNAGAAQHQHQ
jgi:hypothetical protein